MLLVIVHGWKKLTVTLKFYAHDQSQRKNEEWRAQEAPTESPYVAFLKAPHDDFCLHSFDQNGVTWPLLFPNESRKYWISSGSFAIPNQIRVL